MSGNPATADYEPTQYLDPFKRENEWTLLAASISEIFFFFQYSLGILYLFGIPFYLFTGYVIGLYNFVMMWIGLDTFLRA